MIKWFWFIVTIVTFYNVSIINFNAFRYRLMLARDDDYEWAMIGNYVCAICIIVTVFVNVVLFTSILIKNGFTPIYFEDIKNVSGLIFNNVFNIAKFKYHVAEKLFSPFTYIITLCIVNFYMVKSDIYNRRVLDNIRTQYYWFLSYITICSFILY